MTDREYLDKMIELTEQLDEAAKTRSWDPNTYNSVIDEIQQVHASGWRRRRCRPSLMFYVICFLLVIFCFIVWGIIRPL